MHLFPLLALLAKGVNTNKPIRFEESDDFAFYDRYFHVFDDADNPYFDPLTLRRRIATHPHSNVATMRKSTFQNRWGAATSQVANGQTLWLLSKDYSATLVSRAMTRKSNVTRAPVMDIAAWLFRKDKFPTEATATTLLEYFRKTFPMTDSDFDSLFVFRDEAPAKIFANNQLTDDEVRTIVNALEVSDVPVEIEEEDENEETALEEDDPILLEVRKVLAVGSSGIILRGCPGTSKTWYAWNLALALTGNRPDRIDRVQFHPSLGYEDFVEGYRPDEKAKSGFEIIPKRFLNAVDRTNAEKAPFVFIIDEINRGDPARVFGELLTYMETGYRGVNFPLPYSNREISIPSNLIIIATMNPHDRNITQLDMALLRRFDQVDISPSGEKVGEFLGIAGMAPDESAKVIDWFTKLQKLLPFGLGHTYFLRVGDLTTLGTVWKYRILPFCESVLEFETEKLDHVRRSYESLRTALGGSPAGEQGDEQ